MDLSSLLGTVLSGDSVSNIGKAAGVSDGEVKNILGAALPSLLSGALAQSEGSGTADSFAGALTQHAASDTGDLGAFLRGVDLADGAKIVNHLLGSGDAVDEISRKSGASKKDTANVLSAAAPLLMSLLGQQAGQQQQQGGNNSAAVASLMGALLKNVDMGSLLTGLLGGTPAAPAQAEEKEEEKKPDGILGVLGGLFK